MKRAADDDLPLKDQTGLLIVNRTDTGNVFVTVGEPIRQDGKHNGVPRALSYHLEPK